MFCVEFRMCYHKIKVKSFPLHHSQPLITFPHTVFRSQSLKLYEELRARDVLWGGLFYRIQQNSFVVVFFLHRSLRTQEWESKRGWKELLCNENSFDTKQIFTIDFFFISSLFSFSRGTINILFLLVLFALCLSGFADIPLLVHVSLCIRPFSGKRTRF